jgi:hypothetical protein
MRIQREGAQLQIRGTWSAGPGDDQARFLADLRALRDSAAIGYDELAARAHYPSDVLKEAENGPSLPGLPILSAYVRACEGDVPDWEERWRRLSPEVPDDPDLPVRPAGASAAAQAGARAGVGVAPPDVYDPERIKAALRGGHSRTGPGSRRADDPGVLAPAPSGAGLGTADQGLSVDPGATGEGWGGEATSPGWDPAPDTGVTAANGNHAAALGNRGPFDAAFTSLPETAEPAPAAPAAPAEEFSWLKKSEPEPPPAADSLTWPEPAGTGGPVDEPVPDDSDVTWPNAGRAARMEAGSGPADPDITERILRHQAGGLAAQERTDFWGQPLPPAPADLRIPAAPPRAEEPTVTRASWTTAADLTPPAPPAPPSPPAPPAAEPAHRTVAVPAQPVGAVPAQPVTARPTGVQAAGVQAMSTGRSQAQAAGRERDHRQDRYFPARLLAVIVIAALIGSALVLLLK